jgi:hypothetical protein
MKHHLDDMGERLTRIAGRCPVTQTLEHGIIIAPQPV